MNKFKRALKIISTVLTAIIFVCAVAVIINIVVCRAQNRPVRFFGYSFAVVLSSSMEPEIMKGDMIMYKEYDFNDLKVGDYIVFVAGEGFGKLQGQNVVHSVYEITDEGIITKGVNEDTNKTPDKGYVTEENFLGICTYNSAVLGGILSFFSLYGIYIVIALVAIPFIVIQIIRIVKIARSKE